MSVNMPGGGEGLGIGDGGRGCQRMVSDGLTDKSLEDLLFQESIEIKPDQPPITHTLPHGVLNNPISQ